MAPLSEAFVLGLAGGRTGQVGHLLGFDCGVFAGYGQVRRDGAAELAVDPAHRRHGVGRALLDRLMADGAEHVWAHGDLPPARSLAAAAGLRRVRDLYLMRRPLTVEDARPVELPAGFVAKAFVPGRDDEAWVQTNAAAFAGHPEQGQLTVEDLRERMALPWFDPAGLILVEDTRRKPGGPAVAAFHWTKIVPARHAADEPWGEVYVLGVHPAYQGRGLAGPVTRLGLAHLARHGLAGVHLYVDGDNDRARATYARLGFADAAVDVMYAVPGA